MWWKDVATVNPSNLSTELAAIRARHEQFERDYSPGPDWQPASQTHADRARLLALLDAVLPVVEAAKNHRLEFGEYCWDKELNAALTHWQAVSQPVTDCHQKDAP